LRLNSSRSEISFMTIFRLIEQPHAVLLEPSPLLVIFLSNTGFSYIAYHRQESRDSKSRNSQEETIDKSV
jgi:hypothetical protein